MGHRWVKLGLGKKDVVYLHPPSSSAVLQPLFDYVTNVFNNILTNSFTCIFEVLVDFFVALLPSKKSFHIGEIFLTDIW